jgi:hypothetical protein
MQKVTLCIVFNTCNSSYRGGRDWQRNTVQSHPQVWGFEPHNMTVTKQVIQDGEAATDSLLRASWWMYRAFPLMEKWNSGESLLPRAMNFTIFRSGGLWRAHTPVHHQEWSQTSWPRDRIDIFLLLACGKVFLKFYGGSERHTHRPGGKGRAVVRSLDRVWFIQMMRERK